MKGKWKDGVESDKKEKIILCLKFIGMKLCLNFGTLSK